MYDLIVIGAGPGGYESAAHAARLGKKVVLIEKESIGGACLNVGCIPAKTFLRSSKLFHECKEAAKYGVRLGTVEFDMPAVVARKNRVVGTLTKGVDSMLKRAGVEVIRGTARLISRGVVQVGEQKLEAANILLATGSRPAVPPIPGITSERVLDSNNSVRSDLRATISGNCRRRLHRLGVRLFLQRNRNESYRHRNALADRRGL